MVPASQVRCVVGIDPGVTGALAFLFPDAGRVAVEDMPIVAGEVNGAELAGRLRQFRPEVAIVERIHYMPKTGRATVASMMEGFGIIKGVVASLAIPLHIVPTTVWKRHLRLPLGAGQTERDKHEGSRLMALRLYPDNAAHFARKLDHNRAEAALIARYGAEIIPARTLE